MLRMLWLRPFHMGAFKRSRSLKDVMKLYIPNTMHALSGGITINIGAKHNLHLRIQIIRFRHCHSRLQPVIVEGHLSPQHIFLSWLRQKKVKMSYIPYRISGPCIQCSITQEGFLHVQNMHTYDTYKQTCARDQWPPMHCRPKAAANMPMSLQTPRWPKQAGKAYFSSICHHEPSFFWL